MITQEPSVSKPIGNATAIGDLELHEEGEIFKVERSILITFKTIEDFSRVVREGFCKFTIFGDDE